MADRAARYCIALRGSDRPGVIRTVDAIFARHGVGLATIAQLDIEGAVIVLTTRSARESAVLSALDELRDVDVVDDIEISLRFMELSTQEAPAPLSCSRRSDW